jgi:hypothetical protein
MDAQHRLNDAEVTAVLRRAAEVSAQEGLTVAQVHEIAADVGLAPDSVRIALVESANGALRPATLMTQFGVPIGVSKDVVLPGVLTDDAWDVLVSTMRSTFNAHGKLQRAGVVREWRNGNLRIAIEPIPTGHRLRMSTQKDGGLRGPVIGAVATMLYAISLIVTAQARPAMMLLAAIPVAIGGALMALPFLTLPKWARLRSEQFDVIAREAATLVTET